MLIYLFSIICIFLGFFLPPIGGYEQIFLIIGACLFFKKFKETYER